MSFTKTYKVWITLYDNRNHTSKSSNSEIDTLVQATNYQQVQRIVEAQYGGCAVLRQAVEVR
jgi:hypothetical protein